jgi:hypothetical protein
MTVGLIETDERVEGIAEIRFCNFGGSPMAEHNMPCAECVKEPAVVQLTSNKSVPTFQPCWACQTKGWVTVKATGWRRWLLEVIGLIAD